MEAKPSLDEIGTVVLNHELSAKKRLADRQTFYYW
jgi:hypothetical protein